jgi:hypothetical protein
MYNNFVGKIEYDLDANVMIILKWILNILRTKGEQLNSSSSEDILLLGSFEVGNQ